MDEDADSDNEVSSGPVASTSRSCAKKRRTSSKQEQSDTADSNTIDSDLDQMEDVVVDTPPRKRTRSSLKAKKEEKESSHSVTVTKRKTSSKGKQRAAVQPRYDPPRTRFQARMKEIILESETSSSSHVSIINSAIVEIKF